MRDPYEILGVDRKASNDDIQKAYRSLARQHHPDMHQDEEAKKEAQEKFKELSAAYELLGDQQKRSHFDQFGSAPQQGRNPFSGRRKPFGSSMDDFFGQFFHQGQGPGQAKGESIVIEHEITLEEVLHGGEVEVKYDRKELCQKCNGHGGDLETCPTCQGSGMQVIRGPQMSIQRPCDKCRGSGRSVSSKCPDCKEGLIDSKEHISKFNIPQGVEDGMRFVFRGEGHPFPDGASGDVFVIVKVKPHDTFERMQNGNLLLRLPVTYSKLVLGTDVDVSTLEETLNVKIPAGTQVGKKFRIQEKGLPVFRDGRTIYKRGDQFIQVELEVPTELTDRQRQLIEELSQIEGD